MTTIPINNHEIQEWDELNINTDILRGIYAYGFETPSPIQKKACVPIALGCDVIAQAQSGTGKTATFIIGTLARIDTTLNETQAIIISPTRELTVQINDVLKGISCMMKQLEIYTLSSGTHINNDIQYLKTTRPHIITACTGRLLDLIKRGYIHTNHIKLVVIDEVDEMLSSGFREQVFDILHYLNETTRQTVLFSATMPNHIKEIALKITKNPVIINVKAETLTLEGIKQYFVPVENDRQKYDVIKDLYSYLSLSQCIIYCNSVNRVQYLYNLLKIDGYPVCIVHSQMEKYDRDINFKDFKNGKYRILISTNITSRGIDIQQVSVMINFDFPKCKHNYIHRIGRVGRYGRKGVAINIITKYDIQSIKEVEAFYSTTIDELPADVDKILKI